MENTLYAFHLKSLKLNSKNFKSLKPESNCFETSIDNNYNPVL